jgi:pyruvate/2-oxoglutarate dehydrogenase complex dihydrolipoamide acyltransferase (E2) component
MRATGWRKIATSVWGWPNDPQIYGKIEVDAQPVLDAIQELRERSGVRVTATHLVARAIAIALRDNPAINTRLVRGHFLPRESVDVFVIVSAGGGTDLSGVKLRRADEKTAAEMAAELEERVATARTGGGELARAKKLMEALPPTVLGAALRLAAFLTADLGLDLKGLGMPKEAFGSAMITNVGVFGIQEGYAPLSPIYRVPVIVLVGEIERRPWAVGDEVRVHPVLPITATIDHRWVDGAGIAGLAETFRKALAYET